MHGQLELLLAPSQLATQVEYAAVDQTFSSVCHAVLLGQCLLLLRNLLSNTCDAVSIRKVELQGSASSSLAHHSYMIEILYGFMSRWTHPSIRGPC